MQLKITYTEETDVESFCYWLLPYIKSYATNIANQDAALVDNWDRYLTNNVLKTKHGEEISVPNFQEIVYNYFDNLIVVDGADYSATITTDANKKDTYFYTWDYFARLINFGTLDIKGYPYFEEVFEHFASSLQLYYDIWQRSNS